MSSALSTDGMRRKLSAMCAAYRPLHRLCHWPHGGSSESNGFTLRPCVCSRLLTGPIVSVDRPLKRSSSIEWPETEPPGKRMHTDTSDDLYCDEPTLQRVE